MIHISKHQFFFKKNKKVTENICIGEYIFQRQNTTVKS